MGHARNLAESIPEGHVEGGQRTHLRTCEAEEIGARKKSGPLAGDGARRLADEEVGGKVVDHMLDCAGYVVRLTEPDGPGRGVDAGPQ